MVPHTIHTIWSVLDVWTEDVWFDIVEQQRDWRKGASGIDLYEEIERAKQENTLEVYLEKSSVRFKPSFQENWEGNQSGLFADERAGDVPIDFDSDLHVQNHDNIGFPCLNPWSWKLTMPVTNRGDLAKASIFKLNLDRVGLSKLTVEFFTSLETSDSKIPYGIYMTPMLYEKYFKETEYLVSGILPIEAKRAEISMITCGTLEMDNFLAPKATVEGFFVRVDEDKINRCRIMSNPIMFGGRSGDWFGFQWESNCGIAEHVLFIRSKSRNDPFERANCPVHSITINRMHLIHRCEIKIKGSDVFEYFVSSGNHESPKFEFSRKETANSYRIGLVSDSQSRSSVFRHHLLHLSMQKDISLIAHIGDVVQSNGNLKEWKTYWMGPLNEKNIGQRTPIVVARGNHDGNHPFAYSYIFNPGFTNSWFAFNVFTSERKYETSTRIIVLDSNWEDPEENGIRDRQTIWLEYELSHPASKKAAVRVVLLHVPPYLEYWDPKVYEEENQKWGDFIRKEWQPLFETHRVNLVVSGHSHIYQKGEVDGTTYVILGGGGAPLDQEKASDLKIYKTTVKSHHYGIYEFKENEFRMTVLNEHDELIDKFQIHSKRVGFDDD